LGRASRFGGLWAKAGGGGRGGIGGGGEGSRQANAMKRVAHILSYFPGQEGLTSFCRGLGRAFEELEGIEVPVITFRGKPPRNPSEANPPLIKFPHQRRHPFQLPDRFLEALDTGELELDGAVLHGTYSPQAFALARALQKRAIPYIFMPHDPYVAELVNHLALRKWAYWHVCEKWVSHGPKSQGA